MDLQICSYDTLKLKEAQYKANTFSRKYHFSRQKRFGFSRRENHPEDPKGSPNHRPGNVRHLLLAALASGIVISAKSPFLRRRSCRDCSQVSNANGALPYRPSAKIADSALGTTVPPPAKCKNARFCTWDH